MISLIVAMNENGLIGKDNALPWHIKEELLFFKNKTMNKFLLMGETTYLSLPNFLKGRKIFVLSKNKKHLGYKTISDFKYIEDKFLKSKEDIFIAGGKSIYEQFYKKAQILYISIIKKKYSGNVFLSLDLSNYKKHTYKEFNEFIVYKYEKITS